MRRDFGPWTSSLHDGPTPRLGAFWRQRMGRLEQARSSGDTPTRRDVLRLGAAGLAALALPTVRPGRGDEEAGRIFAHAVLKVPGAPGDQVRGLFAIDPDAGTWSKVADAEAQFAASPDGRSIAYVEYSPPIEHYVKPVALWRIDLDGGKPTKIADVGGNPAWSPDGRQIIVTQQLGEPNAEHTDHETWRLQADGSGREKLPIPSDLMVVDWSPDGRLLLAITQRHWAETDGYQLYLLREDGTHPRRFTDEKGTHVFPCFTPHGRAISYLHAGPGYRRIRVQPIDGDGEARTAFDDGKTSHPDAFAWSPDGRRLVVKLEDFERDEEGRPKFDSRTADPRLVVADADGGNVRPIPLPKAEFIYSGLDWA